MRMMIPAKSSNGYYGYLNLIFTVRVKLVGEKKYRELCQTIWDHNSPELFVATKTTDLRNEASTLMLEDETISAVQVRVEQTLRANVISLHSRHPAVKCKLCAYYGNADDPNTSHNCVGCKLAEARPHFVPKIEGTVAPVNWWEGGNDPLGQRR